MQDTTPHFLVGLAPPPASFIPCQIPNRLDNNFTDHVDFSVKRNKRYWILFRTSRQGMYSLKTSCMVAKGPRYTEEEAIGCFQKWESVLLVWALHCYHRHGKCAEHPDSCYASVCPEHPLPPNPHPRVIVVKKEIVKKEIVKKEKSPSMSARRTPSSIAKSSTSASVRRNAHKGVDDAVKRETSVKLETVAAGEASARARVAPPRRPPPSSYTPVPETEYDSDGQRIPPLHPSLLDEDIPDNSSPRAPLFDDDSSDEDRAQTPPSPSPAPGAAARSLSRRVGHPPSPLPTLSASSLSSLSPSTSGTADAPAWKGKQRERGGYASSVSQGAAPAAPPRTPAVREQEQQAPGSSVSRGRGTAAGVVSKDDHFYVSASGYVHHSEDEVFTELGVGPVKVVKGWGAAMQAGREAASSLSAAGRARGGEGPMDVDM